jgi:hypothetical protein
MPEDKSSLHIDTDWKRQAQEEKKRLAEQEAQRKAQQAAAPAAPAGVIGGAATAGARGAARGPGRQNLQPGFAALVQTLVTQILLYLGDLSVRGVEPVLNLDVAKFNLDLLNLLEEKTRGNLTAEEQALLDAALYECRMRFVSVASRVAELP